MPLVLPAVLCVGSGFALASLGSPRRTPLAADLLLRASLSIGFGLGIFSVIFFLARVLKITHLLAIDLAVLAVLLLIYFLLRTRFRVPATNSVVISSPTTIPPWLQRGLAAAFMIALVAALYSAIMRTLAHPHGDGWDAFAIWNLHARFLFRGGPHWRDAFTPLLPWSHPDYPLLLPGAIAHFWTYLGHDDPRIPAVIGFLFTFGTVALLFSALSILRGRASAQLGALTLLTTPFFIEQGASQYADVPLSFFYLATVALLCLYDYNQDDRTLNHQKNEIDANKDDGNKKVHNDGSGNAVARPMPLVLAGLAAGFAAWTKNEGLLFLCALLVARFWLLFRHKIRHNTSPPISKSSPQHFHEQTTAGGWMPFAIFLASVAPALALIAWFKHSLAPPGDLFSDPATTLHKILDPSRYAAILAWYAKTFFRFGHWLPIPGTILLIALFFATRGIKEGGKEINDRQKKDREIKEIKEAKARVLMPETALRSSVLGLTLTLAGYFAVYVITPYDIYWHLHFSLNRLFLQLWPSTIFFFFLALPLSSRPSVSS